MSELSYLKKLLNGVDVEWKKLDDVGEFLRGKRFVKTDIIPQGVPCIHYGELYTHYGICTEVSRSFLDQGVAEKLRVANYGDVIIVAAGETIEDIGNGTAWLGKKNVVFHDACFSFKSKLNPKYISYFLRTQAFKEQIKSSISSGKVSSINAKGLGKAKIPIPCPDNPEKSLAIQSEIVRILDKFAAITDELTAELDIRKKQYKHYQFEILKFTKTTKYLKIEECCEIKKGITPIKKVIPGEYPLVATTEERQSSSTYQFDCAAVCVPLISSRGHGVASIDRIFFQDGKFALGNILCAIIPIDDKVLSAKFLRHYLFDKKDVLLVPLMRGGANVSLTVSSLNKLEIPIPPIAEQQRIVRILDKYDELVKGLPREIELRQKQYEYYRDLLFSFPKPDAVN